MTRLLLSLLLLVGTAGTVAAEPVILRAATPIPDGTAWAREVRAFARDVETRTQGRVHVKLYLNSVAGDDVEMGDRLRRGQVDFVFSGGMLCNEVMPTMRVLRLPGLFHTRDEAKHVMNQLQGVMASEARGKGLVYLAGAPVGSDMFFLRRAVHSLAQLRPLKLWSWDLDAVTLRMLASMGLPSVATDVSVAGRAFDEGRVDGFFSVPTAALAFQWSTRAPYLLDYRFGFLFGCILFSGHSFYQLSAEDQKAFSTATAHFAERIDDIGAQQDAALLGGSFQHQGVTLVPVSESFRAELFAAANAALEREGPHLVPSALIQQVKTTLSDYRAEHSSRDR